MTTKEMKFNVFNVNETAATSKFIDKTLKVYNSVSNDLHIAACAAVYHASFGRMENLQKFYDGLRKNDATALRVWLASRCLFIVDGKEKRWLTVTSGKFATAANTHEVREVWSGRDFDTLLTCKPFLERDAREPDAFDLVTAFERLASSIEKLKKAANKNNAEIPANILGELNHLESELKAKSSPVPADTSAIKQVEAKGKIVA